MELVINGELRRELAKEIHENSVAKGFWENPPSVSHYMMLAISEIGEAVEADRRGNYADMGAFLTLREVSFEDAFYHHIKDSVEDELADTYIRLLDLLEGHFPGILNLDNSVSRFSVSFKNATFTESMYIITSELCTKGVSWITSILRALDSIDMFCQLRNIDLLGHIKMKMQYNTGREPLHGKLY